MVAEDVDTIFRAWSELRAASPCVSYTMEGVSFQAKGSQGDDEPAADSTLPVRVEWLIDFQNARFRRYQSFPLYNEESKRFPPSERTAVYANGKASELIPDLRDVSDPTRETEPQHVEFTENGDNTSLYIWDYFIFSAHGYPSVIPFIQHMQTALKELGKPPNTTSLVHVGNASDDSFPGGLLVLRTKALEGTPQSYDEYWVAPSLGYRIVRILNFSSGAVSYDTSIHYDRTEDGIVHMSAAELTGLRGPGSSVSSSLKLTTTAFALRTPDAIAFRLEPEPGMLVFDEATFRRYKYSGPSFFRRMVWWLPIVVLVVVGIAVRLRRVLGRSVRVFLRKDGV
ncbi:MAG: hypothetical protein HYV60_11045 [Planctomycetia bacterium]|nr:hypothetical protein [Planctomycetia bacterium]